MSDILVSESINKINFWAMDYLSIIALILLLIISLILLSFFLKDRFNTGKREDGLENDEKADVQIGGKKNTDQVLKELEKGYPEAKNIFLKNVIVQGKDLIGFFLVECSDEPLRTRSLKYRYLSRREIGDKQKTIEKGSLPDIENTTKAKGFEFFLDEFKNIYVETEERLIRISAERDDLVSRAKRWLVSVQEAEYHNLDIKDIYRKEEGLFLLMEETGSEKKHHILIDKDEGIKSYEKAKISAGSANTSNTIEDPKLPFTHGIEVELQVVKNDWRWVEGDQMSLVFQQILKSARKKIRGLRASSTTLISDKWSGEVQIEEDDRGYEAVHLGYRTKKKERTYSVFGKDSHVAFKTNILEIQTPPCEHLEELKWWIYNLYRIAHESVEELDLNIHLAPIGTNPKEKYSKGVSFGEHHHIGIEDEELKRKVYNLYRSLIPHLISISSNSPLTQDRSPSFTYNERDNLVITQPSYTTRLKNNIEQFKTPPYLPEGKGRRFFEEVLEREKESLRMVDIFPFTRFGTIEVRLFDTQFTTIDRISIALILQTLAFYAKKELASGNIKFPEKTLKKNRKEAIENGLLGRFYQHEYKTADPFRNNGSHHIYQSWRETVESIWPYLKEIGKENPLAIRNILLRLYSDDRLSIRAPISPAQLLLHHPEVEDDIESILKVIEKISKYATKDPDYNLWSEFLDLEEMSLDDLNGFKF